MCPLPTLHILSNNPQYLFCITVFHMVIPSDKSEKYLAFLYSVLVSSPFLKPGTTQISREMLWKEGNTKEQNSGTRHINKSNWMNLNWLNICILKSIFQVEDLENMSSLKKKKSSFQHFFHPPPTSLPSNTMDKIFS